MASKSKRNRQRRKRKEALLAAPDVAVTVAVSAPDKEKKMGGGIMVPPEREEYQIGGLSKIITSGAKAGLKALQKKLPTSKPKEIKPLTREDIIPKKPVGSDEDARAAYEIDETDIKNFEKQLTTKHPDKNVITFTKKELAETRKEIGDDDAFVDYLSEFYLMRKVSEDIAEIAKERNLSFDMARRLYEYEADKVSTMKMSPKVLEEFEENRKMFEGFDDTPTGQFEGQTINDPPRFLKKAEGGEVPVDTYPNIPPEQMAAVEASQLPDDQMEDKYIDYVLNEALQPEEQTYLMNALENDPQLSMIFDKVVGTASEFTGSGEVEGPGTGVSDSIPARLSDGEFVMTKKATDQIGADRLQRMMDEAERAYDGGLMRKDEDTDLEDDMNKVMLSANQMPSLNVRQR